MLVEYKKQIPFSEFDEFRGFGEFEGPFFGLASSLE